ncbi:MAG: lactonase family protein, partial [Chloroflexi bacterium]|nr:lactonase family protein [Chloroflexota bacterium]
GDSVHPQRQERPHAHSTIFAPDNRFVIVADLGMDELLVYAFDSSAGKLHPQVQTATRPGAGPRHMVFHPGGRRLYVANELDSTVTVYHYEPNDGGLREQQRVDTLPPGAPENAVADIHLSPAGGRVYVSNRGHDSIAVFDVAPDGRLARIAVAPCGGQWPRHFTLAPGGRFILVANQYSDELVALPLLAGPEAIGPPVARAAVRQPSCVQFVEL